jgi:hypothetical protein
LIFGKTRFIVLTHPYSVQIICVAAVEVAEAVGFKFDDPVNHFVEEVAVVGDDEDGADKFVEGLFQDFDGGNVKVVGGFVEQEQIRPFQDEFCQLKAAALATAQIADFALHLIIAEQETVEKGNGRFAIDGRYLADIVD